MPKRKKKKQSAPKIRQRQPWIENNALFEWGKKHPVWAALGLYAIFIFIFYFEVIFLGKTFISPDATAPAALSKPLWDALRNDGVHALWTPYLFGGMPAYASLIFTPFAYLPQIPFNLLSLVADLPPALHHVLHYPFAALGVFLLLRDRNVSFAPALLGGFAFMFTTHLISMEVHGHGSKLMTATYMPLAFWSVNRLFERGGWLNLGLTALILGFQFQRGHVQIVYYTWMLLGAFLVFTIGRKIYEKQVAAIPKILGRFAAVLALGFGMAAMLYLPILEYTPHSIRGSASVFARQTDDAGVGFDYATQWSFSGGEMMTFIVPSYYGYGGNTYWGAMPFTDYPHYMGILIFLLGIFAMIAGRREPFTWFLGAVIFLALLISFGKNFPPVYKFFYNVFPFFNKFRVPVMILVVVQMSFAVLAGLGLQKLMNLGKDQSDKKKSRRQAARPTLLYASLAVVGVALLLTLAQSGFFSFLQGQYAQAPQRFAPSAMAQINQMRFDMLMKDLWLVAFFIAAGLLLLHRVRRGKMQPKTFAVLVVLITLVDLWIVNSKINQPQDQAEFARHLNTDELSRLLADDASTYRVFPVDFRAAGVALSGDNRWAAQGLQSIGGYHAAKPRVYQDFLEGTQILGGYMTKYYRPAQQRLEPIPEFQINPQTRKAHQNLLDMLNVKYVISPFPIPESAMQLKGQVRQNLGRQQIPLQVYENTSVLPRAWLVGNYRKMEGAKEALLFIASGKFDPRTSVILYQESTIKPEPDSTAVSELLSYGLHEIRIKTKSQKPQMLVLSDTWFPPGWKATIDGEEQPILQANHAFRAVALPAGAHEIVFEFSSSGFNYGLILSILSTIVVVGLIFFGRKK